MPSLRQVSIVNRFKPERNGNKKIINQISLKSKQVLEIQFPVNSSVMFFPIF